MQREPDPASTDKSVPSTPRTDCQDAPVDGNDSSGTKQTQLDQSAKRTHEPSENELPSTQEKNPVPPGSTKP